MPKHLSDRMLQWISERLPDHLPERLKQYRAPYEHHLMLKVLAAGIDEARAFLPERFAQSGGAYFECRDEEGRKAVFASLRGGGRGGALSRGARSGGRGYRRARYRVATH